LIAVHDLDARRDLVGVLLPADVRARFATRRKGPGLREAETVDFSGTGRELVVDFLQGALRLPAAVAPHICEFPADSYWAGEAHRLCDRPELGARLIEEISIMGIEQVLLVSAAAPAAVPHGMRSMPLNLRARMRALAVGRNLSAAGRLECRVTRFSGVFVIRPDPIRLARSISPARMMKRPTGRAR
jgi:hypothetical protein